MTKLKQDAVPTIFSIDMISTFPLNRKRSKSLISNTSCNSSYKEAVEKLKKLNQEEDKIKKQKTELANFECWLLF